MKEERRKERKEKKRVCVRARARVRERDGCGQHIQEMCPTDCEPGKKTERSLSDITNQCRHDRLDRMPGWAGELVPYVGAHIVRCQKPVSSQLKHGVDVVQLVRSFSPSLTQHKNNSIALPLSSIC